MLSLRWGNQTTLWGSDETAAILLGSARETKPQYDTKNLTIFQMSTFLAENVTAAGEARLTKSYNRKLKHGSDEHDGN
jgi:hypothetical protein